MDIGFIGLGRMGGAMARNLAQAGHRVRAWNRSPVAGRLASGMAIVSSPAEALRADAAFTMLSDDSAIRDVLLSSDALNRAWPGLVHVVTSTISVGFADELRVRHAEVGIGYVSAPVFGRPEAAEAAQLELMAAGETHAVAKVRPLLDVIGRRTWVLGEDPKQANAAKIAGNRGAEELRSHPWRTPPPRAAAASATSVLYHDRLERLRRITVCGQLRPGRSDLGITAIDCMQIALGRCGGCVAKAKHQGGACGAAGPASAPGSALGRPARRTPGHTQPGRLQISPALGYALEQPAARAPRPDRLALTSTCTGWRLRRSRRARAWPGLRTAQTRDPPGYFPGATQR